MIDVRKLSNAELRLALATVGEDCWRDAHVDCNGQLVGFSGGLSFTPVLVPNWPESISDAMRLEELLRQKGLLCEYVRNLAAVTHADVTRPTGLFAIAHASAKQRSEAALITLQSVRTVT